MTLKERLNLSYVPRWAIVPMTRHQSVSDHSWRVAILARDLYDRLVCDLGMLHENLPVTEFAIAHDIEEASTGDVPSTIKDLAEPPKDVTRLIVKVADVLETRTWLRLWGHPTRIKDVLEDNDPKWSSLLYALEGEVPGARMLVLEMEKEIVGEGL